VQGDRMRSFLAPRLRMGSIQLLDVSRPDVPAGKRKERRGYSSIVAIDPHDGGYWHVLLSDDRLRRTALRGEAQALELAETVRWMLLHPFRGPWRCLRDDGDAENGWCYFGIPQGAFGRTLHSGARAYPPWPGQVFLVFVDEERVICNWYWHVCDSDDHNLPKDYQIRFRGPTL
jgi:hypothetical protein